MYIYINIYIKIYIYIHSKSFKKNYFEKNVGNIIFQFHLSIAIILTSTMITKFFIYLLGNVYIANG